MPVCVLIHMSRASSVRQRLDQLLPALARQAAFEVDHLATAMGLVQARLGIIIMPAMTLFHFRRDGLVILPIAGAELTHPERTDMGQVVLSQLSIDV